MILENYYYRFTKAIPKDICEKIIDLGKQKTLEKAKIDKNKKAPKKIRDSKIIWLTDQWLYDLIQPWLNEANKEAKWNFNIDWNESFQFTVYGKNQHYDWHTDQTVDLYSNKQNLNFDGKTRKISMSLNLSDPSEYKGGELNFCWKDKKMKDVIVKDKDFKKQGSLIFFPSFIWHKVSPVTSGTRYSLVLWSIGKPFA
jgi:PKHD-type hydroxylase